MLHWRTVLTCPATEVERPRGVSRIQKTGSCMIYFSLEDTNSETFPGAPELYLGHNSFRPDGIPAPGEVIGTSQRVKHVH